MRFYGYSKKRDKNGCLELKECSIQANPKELKEIAQFLLECSREIEKNSQCWDHKHFKAKNLKIGKNTPEFIIINALY